MVIIIINVKNIIYMCVCNYLFVHSYIGNCINFTQSYCLVIICFCNGIVHLLDAVCQQSNQTMFSHSWLPWKCQHRDYRVNLPVTPPLSSTSHLAGTEQELNDSPQNKCDSWMNSRNIPLLHTPCYVQAERWIAFTPYALIWSDGYSLKAFRRRKI